MNIAKYIMKNKEYDHTEKKLIDAARDGDTHYSSEEAIYRNRHN